MATQQVVPVTCPNCNARFTTPIENIIDGQNQALKTAFLQGSLNIAQCPQCGLTSPLGLPLLYYDLEKELALALVPNGLQISSADQQKLIGDLTNRLVNSLPAEQRKYYLLNPKQFLTLESMAKAILEADGITEEMLQAQADKVKLIEEFLQAKDEATLKEKVKKHDAELDREFFEILTASIQAAQLEGNQAGMQTLFTLRTLLVRWSTQGRQAVDEIDEELGLIYIKSQEELLEKLKTAKDESEFAALVATGYPLLDYGFFQKLTAQIDDAMKAGDKEKSQTLINLRQKILDAKAQQEETSRAALEKAGELLKQVLQADDPAKILERNLDKIDQTFFVLLSANIQEAQRQKHAQAAQALEIIGNMAASMIQERMEAAKPEASQPNVASKIHLPK